MLGLHLDFQYLLLLVSDELDLISKDLCSSHLRVQDLILYQSYRFLLIEKISDSKTSTKKVVNENSLMLHLQLSEDLSVVYLSEQKIWTIHIRSDIIQ